MAISLIGSGSAEAATVTIPAGHQLGDVLLIFAFRSGSTTNPSLPAGWKSLQTNGANLCSAILGWKYAVSSSDVSGTWTNATGIMVHVYRGADPIAPFSACIVGTGATSPSVYSSTLPRARMNNQWFIAFQGNKDITTTTMNNAPTGFTNVINFQSGVTNNLCSFDTNGSSEFGNAASNVAPGGTPSGWEVMNVALYPPMQAFNNYQQPRVISAGIISVGEKIR